MMYTNLLKVIKQLDQKNSLLFEQLRNKEIFDSLDQDIIKLYNEVEILQKNNSQLKRTLKNEKREY